MLQPEAQRGQGAERRNFAALPRRNIEYYRVESVPEGAAFRFRSRNVELV